MATLGTKRASDISKYGKGLFKRPEEILAEAKVRLAERLSKARAAALASKTEDKRTTND